jgi:hypothetical protein
LIRIQPGDVFEDPALDERVGQSGQACARLSGSRRVLDIDDRRRQILEGGLPVRDGGGRYHDRRNGCWFVGVGKFVPVLQTLRFNLLARIAGALHGLREHTPGGNADAIGFNRRERLIVVEKRHDLDSVCALLDDVRLAHPVSGRYG